MFLYIPSIFLQLSVIVTNTQLQNLISVAASLAAYLVHYHLEGAAGSHEPLYWHKFTFKLAHVANT